jgi:hypothetical protein
MISRLRAVTAKSPAALFADVVVFSFSSEALAGHGIRQG